MVVRGRIVGALTCQQDSCLYILQTDVVSCLRSSPSTAPQNAVNAASLTKNNSPSSLDTWLFELADSVLFSKGGGQPADHGTVLPLSSPSADAVPIKHVQRQVLRCLLHSPRPLSPGERARQEADYRRRWDHMQQHTGQHLLSAIMDTYDNLKTLGRGMGAMAV
ncbi:hypothetical protein QQX98_007031 [Neonectria punicea]|uniref:Uncharacterized protein n=1 Tax=Neonectria punicea TaxID=979145 RepID=A0ABR1GZ17_9HYPO